jgi:NTE family protein
MRSLVLSGGSSKGSWSAGAIKHLLGDLQIHYGSLHGVSVGAINASFLAQFPEGQEKDAAKQMEDLWLSLNTDKIYTRWKPFGRFHVLWMSSFYNSQPLMDLIREHIKLDKIRTSGKQVDVGATSLSTGKYYVSSQRDDDFIEFVIGSSAFPGLLCPIKIRDQLWMDGGCQELSPVRAAIEAGATEIDVITTSPDITNKEILHKPSIVDIFKRTVDLSTDRILDNDINSVLIHNKLAEAGVSDKAVIKVNIFRPHYNLTNDLLDFNPKKLKEMFEKGYKDTVANYKHIV